MALKDWVSGLFQHSPPPIALAKPPSPPTGEAAYSKSGSQRGQARFQSYNPNELQLRKGSGIYEKMLQDPQVWAVYNLVVELLLSRKWRFVTDKTKRQEKLKRFFLANVDAMDGNFTDILRKLMTAKQTGVSLVEKIYWVHPWEGVDHWMLKAAKLRPLSTFTFEEDPYGNVIKLYQNVAGNRLELEPERFIRYINHTEFDPVWGRSDLISVYTPWWEKNNIAKMWDTYLERLAAGFVAIKQTGQVNPTAQASLQDILSNLGTAMGVILPQNTEIELVHAAATDAFERAMMQKNLEIARAFLVPQLLGFSEQGRVGSYAQAEVQSEVFFQYLINEGDRIADVLNESLWAELAEWNFGAKDFPHMVFEPFTEAHKKRILESWGLMLEKGAVTPQPEDAVLIRKWLGFDEIAGVDMPKEPPLAL